MEPTRPDHESICTWTAKADPKTSPHTRNHPSPLPDVLPNVLHAIGNTPMVRLNKIPKAYGLNCEMLVKCEFLNPGGSVKDRIAFRMIEDAEKKGLLSPGSVIIEPTSGNTGIGLAMAAAVKGYRCIIVMPEKMSNEKVNVLRALGAEIIRTPTEAAFDSPESHMGVSYRLAKEIPNSIILNQYTNPGNPLAHYDMTAEEIIAQCGGKLDMLVLAAGTGGTVSGVGRKIKERLPHVKIVGVDPHGSILAEPHHLNHRADEFYEVEGIGYDFIPTVFDRSVVDYWFKSHDKESFLLARQLIKEEGLLCGGSSGAVMSAAVELASSLTKDQRCVVLLPDNVRNYLTKFLSDQWMEARDFKDPVPAVDHWWWNLKATDLKLAAPTVVSPNITCTEAIDILKRKAVEQLPVVDSKGEIKGIVSLTSLMSGLASGKVTASDLVKQVTSHSFLKISSQTTIGRLSRILEAERVVLIVDSSKNCSNGDAALNEPSLLGVVTAADLLSFITSK